MKAMLQEDYGSLDALQSRDIRVPDIGDREVLVRVRAAALHIGDVFGVKGLASPDAPGNRPSTTQVRRPGLRPVRACRSGRTGVLSLRVGDEVFGYTLGTCAEYARAAENKLAPKPANLSFVQAAALPTSGLAALHGLRDAGKLRAGQKALIVGASGGVGSSRCRSPKPSAQR